MGFGKTEVALRAVMKAVMDGKQVAILVPTTVLAQQHYQTAVARFRGFPVTIDVLSRFRTPKMQQQTLQKLRAGSVDLIIGTHKLLQKTSLSAPTSSSRRISSSRIWAFSLWTRSSASASAIKSG